MATGRPVTVDEWAPLFLYYGGGATAKFDEAWLSNPENVLSRYGSGLDSGRWCKLCDAPVPDSDTSIDHLAAHLRELASWRKRRRSEAERRLREGAQAARQERALERSVLSEPEKPQPQRASNLPLEKQLKNRITSIRHRMSNPAKFKRDSWSESEVAQMQSGMDAAALELATLAGDGAA